MGDSYTCLINHVCFSTHSRRPQIVPALKPKLHAYMAGILRKIKCPPVLINGVQDHVHILTYRHPTVCESDLARVVKSNSSGWVHDTFPEHRDFDWQNGYSAFSVSKSNIEAVREYIANQEEHHRQLTWREEIERLYIKHEIPFDPKYLD
jgi:REP element-mobilizing transposase RayT